MRRGTLLPMIALAALAAAGSAGCGGSLTSPDAAVADTGVFARPDGRLPRLRDAAPIEAPAVGPCPNMMAAPVGGTSCQFSIPNVAACTGLGIRVHVLIDGAELPQLPDDGWTFTDATETTIELHGGACERAAQSPTGVTIVFTSYLP